MAIYRETPCKFYLAAGQCAKGREAKAEKRLAELNRQNKKEESA